MPKYLSDEFLKLQRIWYAKIKKLGFKDIECTQENSLFPLLKGKSKIQAHEVEHFDRKQEYFERCGEFLHVHKFRNADQKKIFELHTAGIGIREIASSLGLKPGSFSRPFRTIKHLRFEMMKYFYGKRREEERLNLQRGAGEAGHSARPAGSTEQGFEYSQPGAYQA